MSMNSENYLESRDPLVVEDVMRPPDVKLDQEWCVGGVKLFYCGRWQRHINKVGAAAG